MPEVDRLLAAPYINLTTYRRTGEGVTTPVWFARVGQPLYVFSAGNAGKVKRLRADARVAIARCDARGGPLGERSESTATLVSGEDEAARAYAALLGKYGWQMRVANFFSALSGRKKERVLIRIEAPGHA